MEIQAGDYIRYNSIKCHFHKTLVLLTIVLLIDGSVSEHLNKFVI